MIDEITMTKEAVRIGANFAIKPNCVDLYELNPEVRKPHEINEFSEIAWPDPFPFEQITAPKFREPSI